MSVGRATSTSALGLRLLLLGDVGEGKERKSRREFCLSSRGRRVPRPVPRKTGNVCPFFLYFTVLFERDKRTFQKCTSQTAATSNRPAFFRKKSQRDLRMLREMRERECAKRDPETERKPQILTSCEPGDAS